jgi:hypothetical protein
MSAEDPRRPSDSRANGKPGVVRVAAALSSGSNLPAHGRLVTWVALFVVLATPLAVGCHYVARAYCQQRYPWDAFLLNPKWHFGDYYLVYLDAQRFHPGGSTNVVCSTLLHMLMTGLTPVPATAEFALMCPTFVAVLIALLWGWVTASDMDLGARLQQVAILALVSYPVLFVLVRGNLEMVVFILLAAFFCLYYARGSRWPWVPLALAIARKYYRVTLLLLLSDTNVRQAVYAVVGAVTASAGSVALIARAPGHTLVRSFRTRCRRSRPEAPHWGLI